MQPLAHPGHVTFVEQGPTGSERVVPIDQVPESLAFVRENGVAEPVVRVVSRPRGDSREVKSYGVDGRLLLTTFQRLARERRLPLHER